MLNPFLLFLVVDQLFLNSFPISLSSKIFGTRLIRRRLHFLKIRTKRSETVLNEKVWDLRKLGNAEEKILIVIQKMKRKRGELRSTDL